MEQNKFVLGLQRDRSSGRKIFSSEYLEEVAGHAVEPVENSRFRESLEAISPVNVMKRFKIHGHQDEEKKGLGSLLGTLIPTCENMWGILFFLRFFYVVGNAGIWQSYLIITLSFLCALLTTMSLSAVATNGPGVEVGGTYYLVSRALGPKLGGSVGVMYYLGVSLLAVLEALGSVEMITFTFPALEFSSANRVIGALFLIILCAMVFFGIKFVSKLSLVFFGILLYSMGSYFVGFFVAPRADDPPIGLTGLSWKTYKDNWNSNYESGVSFPVGVSVLFPCFAGILSGADRAKNLREPQKSIPRGAIGAVCISFILYIVYMSMWGAVGTRNYLLGLEPDRNHEQSSGGHSENLSVIADISFPLAILTQIGIVFASVSQALQCLITSPRLLQAIASDGVIPLLNRINLCKLSQNGEPKIALLFTLVLCLAATMIGSLDGIAPFVSICFLTCYAALNFSCVVLSLLKAPSWRPKWRFYHWSVALVGFLLCLAMMVIIKWYWTLVAVVAIILIYIYIDYRQVEVDWGTGLGGLRLQLAVQNIMSVGHEARYNVNWRPQLLCLIKPRAARPAGDKDSQKFLTFVSHLKKGRGLCVVVSILEGNMEEMGSQVKAESVDLENAMESASVRGFSRVLVAPSYSEGKTYAIQSSGLGSLEPNTLVVGWPTTWNEVGHEETAEVMLRTLSECKTASKAVLLCMHIDEFPTGEVHQEGYIDIWWIVHDGGLLLILAHLLKRHKVWRKCKLRVHTVSERFHDSSVVKRNLIKLLEQVRIEAEVQVLELDDGLAPYTFDYTIRLEEARAFADEVAQYRLAQERRTGQEQLEKAEKSKLVKQASQKAGRKEVEQAAMLSKFQSTVCPVERHTPDTIHTKDNVHQDGTFVARTSERNLQRTGTYAEALPTMETEDWAAAHQTENHRQASFKARSRRFSSNMHEKENASKAASGRFSTPLNVVGAPEHDVPQMTFELSRHGSAPSILSASGSNIVTPAISKSASRSGGEIFKHSIPGSLILLEDGVHQSRLRNGGPVSDVTLNVRADFPDGHGGDSVLTIRTTAHVEAASEISFHSGDQERIDASHNIEVVVEESCTGQEFGKEDVPEDGTREGMVHSESAGQLYPGSPHHTDRDSHEVPESMKRTWETFSQSYSPARLNEIILEHSQNAQLLLLNLPDHYQGMEPNRYMEYCEELTAGLRRVILVRGTGKELWTAGI